MSRQLQERRLHHDDIEVVSDDCTCTKQHKVVGSIVEISFQQLQCCSTSMNIRISINQSSILQVLLSRNISGHFLLRMLATGLIFMRPLRLNTVLRSLVDAISDINPWPLCVKATKTDDLLHSSLYDTAYGHRAHSQQHIADYFQNQLAEILT